MKKSVFALAAAVFVSGAAVLFASGSGDGALVDMDILSNAKKETYIEDKSAVSWKNFNTGKQIRDMGRRVGAEVRYQAEENKSEYPFSSGYPDYKYKAARVYPSSKMGADVVYIGRLAKVGTFKNLNRVLSGYIEKAYGVTMEEADQIALKVCYWNTNHYGDRAYFTKNFNHRVVEVFANRTKKIGLPRSYKDWQPTRIVIPFTIVKETVPEAVEPVAPVEPVEQTEQVEESAPVEEAPAEEVIEPAETVSREEVYDYPYEAEEEEEGGFGAFVKAHLPLIAIGAGVLLLLIIVIAAVANGRKREM